MKLRTLVCALALSLPLAACGGPSDSDVKKAVQQQLSQAVDFQKQLTNFAGSLFGKDTTANSQAMDKTLADAQILVGDKNKQADGSYIVVVTVKMGGDSNTNTVRMLKGADGWVVKD